MQLKRLKAFQAVANARSFSEAAHDTGLPQPTLSRLIKQLEDDIGVTLIDRYHRPLELTEAGAFFFEKISVILNTLDSTITLTQRIVNPPDTLSIGFVPSVLYGLLPTIISTLKQQLPTLDINLKDINSFAQIDALKAGVIDVGFGRFANDDIEVMQRLLRHERYIAALPITHPLAATAEIHLSELQDDKLILYHRTHLLVGQPVNFSNSQSNNQSESQFNSKSVHQHRTESTISEPLLYLFDKQSTLPHRTTLVSDIQVALGLVAAGEGITLVPDSLKTVRPTQISYCSLVHEDATSPIYLNTLKQPIHPAFNTMLETIYAIYEEKGITYRRYQAL